jgi:hypothetical protein
MPTLAHVTVSSAMVVIGLAFSPETVLATSPMASPSQSSSEVCHNIKGSVRVPEAPRGFAYVVTSTLTSNCQLLVSQPTMIADPQPTALAGAAATPSANGAVSTSEVVAGPHATVSGPASADPVATSYYRLWDQANIKLNASATSINWSTSNGKVSSATATLYTYYYNDGWFLNWHSLKFYTGCVGCTSLGAQGAADFCFDTCSPYENLDFNYITADGDGSYSNCYSSWTWTTGFPGWHTQTWCGWGYTGV